MGRPLKIAYCAVLGVLAVSALGLAYVHLHHSTPGGSAELHGALATTTSIHQTTTTVALPAALQPGAETAATALVSSWSTGNRATALSVATPTAVNMLFAAHYTSGQAIDRGCSTAFIPIKCTFGPPAGASPTDPIYELSVSQALGGWYVSGVRIEN